MEADEGSRHIFLIVSEHKRQNGSNFLLNMFYMHFCNILKLFLKMNVFQSF